MSEDAGKVPQQQSLIIGGMTHIAPPRKFWTRGKLFVLFLFLAALGVGGYYGYDIWKGEKKEAVEIPTFKVKKDTLEISVTEEGTLQSLKSHPIKADFRGNAKIEWIIPEETQVKKGDVVLRFDTQDVQKQIEDLEVALKEAEDALVRAREDDVIATRDDQANLLKVEKEIRDAEEELVRFLNSDVPRKRSEFRMRIRKARQQLREVEAEVTDMPYLIERQLKTLSDLEKARILLEQRKADLKNAEEDYRIYLEYELPRQLASKREAVEDLKRKYERMKSNVKSKAAQRRASIRRAEKKLESIKRDLKRLRERLGKMVLKAPADGVIYYGSGDSGRFYYGGDDIKESLKPGNSIWTGQVLMHIPDTTKMKVSVQVLESDISKIKVGLPAIITVPALDNAKYTGKVTKKARSARNIRYWDPTSTKVVPCEILIDKYDERLTPGSTVKVKILVKTIRDVLIVPLECVFEKDGHPIVYLKTGPGETCEARRVKLGDHNNDYVVVEKGLKEGDEIFQYPPSTADSAPVTGEVYAPTPPPVPSPKPSVEPSRRPRGPRNGGNGGREIPPEIRKKMRDMMEKARKENG